MSFRIDFASPPAQYRGKPFWSWNGDLEPAELRRQVRVFHRMGMGGFFMHSRIGLATPYLGRRWFTCVKACIDEAARLGMEAWLYDEDRWPSGAAGGLATRNPKYRQRLLLLEQFDRAADFRWMPDTLAAFTARLRGATASDVRRLDRGAAGNSLHLPQGHCILSFRGIIREPSDWYNGSTYLDTLNKDAVAEFIRVTHEAYRKNVGRRFGRLVPGIFTDEPTFISLFIDDKFNPWTDKLPEIFRRRCGYDLLDHLVSLYFNIAGRDVAQVRWHYYDLLTHLFTDAFAMQIGQWCGDNGLLFTGHVLQEDDLVSQGEKVGSCMRFYEHMQAPGIDLLGLRGRNCLAAKQVASAARQFGRKWRLSELYGCTGWDFPFAGHKAMGDWQAALGINLRCQHLSYYTMLAEAKRDYPASIFFQSPWWEHYGCVEDYFARINTVITRGAEVRDLLVIHPIESVWLLRHKTWNKDRRPRQLDKALKRICNMLLARQLDFDLGDEELLSRHCRVESRQGDARLSVGKARYKAVLAPPMLTMRSSTLRRLEKFASAGGQVVFAGRAPARVDGRPSPKVREFAGQCSTVPLAADALDGALSPQCRRLAIVDEKGGAVPSAVYQLRQDASACYLFVVNTAYVPKRGAEDVMVEERKAAHGDVRIIGFEDCDFAPIELDPLTGGMTLARARRQGGKWEVRTALPPLASRIFVFPRKKAAAVPPPRPPLRDVSRNALAARNWDYTLSEDNNLVLDRPRFRIGRGQWQGPTDILRIDKALRQRLGLPPRDTGTIQPWAQKPPKNAKSVAVELEYTLRLQVVPAVAALALEQPRRFSITVNGKSVANDGGAGWWVDPSLRRIPLAGVHGQDARATSNDRGVLREGHNVLRLKCTYDHAFTGLETVCLLGRFGVRVDGADASIAALPRQLQLGDWTGQGLAFYGGNVTYLRRIDCRLREGRRMFVRIGRYRGTAVRVLVDGRPAGTIGWAGNELDITDFLRGGSALLGLELLGHRRNSHGPLHLNVKSPGGIGPDSFESEGPLWSDAYKLAPCGLMSPPELVIRQ